MSCVLNLNEHTTHTRCTKTGKSSQISLYLEEPATCSYILTVEGAFVCALLEHLEEDGLFNKDVFQTTIDKTSFETTNDKTAPLDKGVPEEQTIDKDKENNNFVTSEATENGIEDSVQEESLEDVRSRKDRSHSREESNDREKGQRS